MPPRAYVARGRYGVRHTWSAGPPLAAHDLRGDSTVLNRRAQSRPPFLFALLLVLALIAAACGGNDDGGDDEGGGTTTTARGGRTAARPAGSTSPRPRASPRSAARSCSAWSRPIASLDPAGSLAQPSDVLTALAIYDHLIDYDADAKLIPSLATEWSSSEDLMTWTIKVRTDVEFQDGTPFNAAAVKAQFDRLMDPATNCTCAPHGRRRSPRSRRPTTRP